MRPLLRRPLVVAVTAGAFLLLAVLGLGLAALFSPGEAARPEPEPVRPAPPPTAPAPSPPAEPREPPRPPPVPAPVTQAPPPPTPVLPSVLSLPTRLQIRRELIRGLGAFKDELARCPADPVQRKPGTRSALVLEMVGENDTARVVGSTLESEVPVNERFTSCVSAVLQGKSFAAPGAKAGLRLRFFLPIGPAGNSLSPTAASLAEADASR